jgi:hypothetical protein
MGTMPTYDILSEYRLLNVYDPDGSLLYLGISNEFWRRWHQHQQKNEWTKFVVYARLEHYNTRKEAEWIGGSPLRWKTFI